ncbi:MAG: RNA polymerase subunit sigma [Bdellovibrionales bacterium CG10_big_fil_rev_8_21_14_0_10_45_34]|nr:MAG: RNA polymerase subunit sigma [Bdellovibrionales bacterium CG10_big_fil_rev_8_21_14_0_10_45_34]
MHSDIELVVNVQSGSIEAFSELVKRHQVGLIRMCFRVTRDMETAQEVAQDAFVKAYQKIGAFEGRSSFKSWLYQIGINTAKNSLRKHMITVSSDDIQIASLASSPEGKMVRNDVKAALDGAIEQLPDKQRLAVQLRIFEDMSFEEVSQAMDCPYDTAKANFRHGLMKLKDRFLSDDVMKAWLSQLDTEFNQSVISRESEAGNSRERFDR